MVLKEFSQNTKSLHGQLAGRRYDYHACEVNVSKLKLQMDHNNAFELGVGMIQSTGIKTLHQEEINFETHS